MTCDHQRVLFHVNSQKMMDAETHSQVAQIVEIGLECSECGKLMKVNWTGSADPNVPPQGPEILTRPWIAMDGAMLCFTISPVEDLLTMDVQGSA